MSEPFRAAVAISNTSIRNGYYIAEMYFAPGERYPFRIRASQLSKDCEARGSTETAAIRNLERVVNRWLKRVRRR